VAEVTITLIAKPDCHLCEQAHQVIIQVIGDQSIRLEVLSLLDHPDLMAEYSEEIPVILINGEVHDFFRVNADRLQAAIDKARNQ
jgi:glutaredoxin